MKEYMTVKEASDVLNVSKQRLYRMVSSHQLKGVIVNKMKHFRTTSVYREWYQRTLHNHHVRIPIELIECWYMAKHSDDKKTRFNAIQKLYINHHHVPKLPMIYVLELLYVYTLILNKIDKYKGFHSDDLSIYHKQLKKDFKGQDVLIDLLITSLEKQQYEQVIFLQEQESYQHVFASNSKLYDTFMLLNKFLANKIIRQFSEQPYTTVVDDEMKKLETLIDKVGVVMFNAK